MPYDFYAKKKKTPDDIKRAARVREAIRAKGATPAKKGPKRSVSY